MFKRKVVLYKGNKYRLIANKANKNVKVKSVVWSSTNNKTAKYKVTVQENEVLGEVTVKYVDKDTNKKIILNIMKIGLVKKSKHYQIHFL